MSISSLNPPYTLELVTYDLNDNADAADFLELNRHVGKTFTSSQPGFLHREIGRNEEGSWLIAVFWKSAEDAKNSIANINSIPDMQTFDQVKLYMSMINRDTLRREIFEIV